MSHLNIQQTMLLEQKRQVLDLVNRTGEHLDTKTGLLLQISGMITALIGVLSFPDVIFQQPTIEVNIAIGLSFLIFAAMIVCAILAWFPAEHHHPGSLDWNQMHRIYLLVEPEKSYQQTLRDYVGTIGQIIQTNKRKAVLLRLSMVLFAIQIIGLLILAFYSQNF